ncbi:MAG: NAD-dependent malic enzyme [Deltaproteobacteria bacterium]|nr:NAD-dependent malic enzyme [Deltaproteobacteria bacterium]
MIKMNPSYSVVLRVRIPNRPGMLGKVLSVIGRAGGDVGAIAIVGFEDGYIIRDIEASAPDLDEAKLITAAVKRIEEIRVLNVADRTLLLHQGGKLEVMSKVPLKTRYDLAMAYTPGVARVAMAIHESPERAYELTIKKNTVAIVTDGTAVLGLGDIGPRAALPVMEGKALLFKNFGGVDAFPICLDTRDPEEIVKTVKWISPGFGGVMLEDISSPRCFGIESRLKKELDIPVFHSDQHSGAVAVLAGLSNALRVVGKGLAEVRIVVCGLGAAGIGLIRLLGAAGAGPIIGCDRAGILYRGRRENMHPVKEEIALVTNPSGLRGGVADALAGADVFIGVSEARSVHPDAFRQMAKDAIVFALANPVPEVLPGDVEPFARVIATGRPDYDNQISNTLCFPGLFRGAFDCRAREINREMLIAAAGAIAACVVPEELMESNIIPSLFNRQVSGKVAQAVSEAAIRTGVGTLAHKQAYFSG